MTSVPNDVFVSLLRAADAARASGSHVEAVNAKGKRCLRRVDLAGEMFVEALLGSPVGECTVTFQLPTLPPPLYEAKLADETFCSTRAQSEATESEDSSTSSERLGHGARAASSEACDAGGSLGRARAVEELLSL